MDFLRPRVSLVRRGRSVDVNHEVSPAELELKLTQERLRKLEQELKEVRQIAEEAMRIAKRTKREIIQHS